MPSESELYRQQQYVKVLREVTAGDNLGPSTDDDSAPATRQFEMSRKAFPAALIDQMIAEKLLAPNGERGVVVGPKGERFFTRNR